jgi:hypothetical protein
MNRQAQARRDLQIALERTLGFSEVDVAQRYGVDCRTVRRVYKRWKEDRIQVEDLDPCSELTAYLLRLDAAIAELGLIRMSARNSRVRVAAIRAQLAAMSERMRVLMDVGVVPRVDAVDSGHAALRAAHATQIGAWIRKRVRTEELPAELASWVRDVIADWTENGPKRPFEPEGDTF